MISKLWLDVVKASFYGVKFLSTFFSFSNLILMEVAHLATSSHEGCSFSYFLAVFQIYVAAAVCSLYWSKEREKTKKWKQDPTYRNSNSEVLFRKKCSENMQQIYRGTLMLKCYFNKVAKQLYSNHTSAWAFFCKFTVYFQKAFS